MKILKNSIRKKLKKNENKSRLNNTESDEYY